MTVIFGVAVKQAFTNEDFQTETELAKKMMTKWDTLILNDGLAFRNKNSTKKEEFNFPQLLLL